MDGVENNLEGSLESHSSCRFMSIIATTSNLSILIFTLSEVLGLRMTEKLHSHSAEVIGNVHDFQQNQQVRESFLNAFLNVFANVSDRS